MAKGFTTSPIGNMNKAPFQEEERSLTQDTFDQFLRRVDSNREIAGTEYEMLRRALIIFFEQHGKLSPEDFANETLNRVAKVLSEGTKIDDLGNYALTVARSLLGENWRSPQTETKESQPHLDLRQAEELRLECMKKCLKELPAKDHKLIQKYYGTAYVHREEQRKKMADQMGISLNALRDRIHHVRSTLEVCLANCLG